MKPFNYNVSGTVELENEIIGKSILYSDDINGDSKGKAMVKDLDVSIILTNSSTVVRVKHIDHGMYSTSNNVEIRNVSSGLSTTLNESLQILSTFLVLDPTVSGGSSVTGFDASNDSSKIYLKINDEIMKGTLSGLNVTSITRAQGDTTIN